MPGWTLDATFDAILPGSDAHGSYLTSDKSGGAIKVISGTIDDGNLDTAAANDGRSYVVTYALGTGTSSLVYVWWVNDTNYSYFIYSDISSSANGVDVTNGRFTLYDFMGTRGHFVIQTNHSGNLYRLGDNVARQQLSEPFSQQAGAGIDTSTGSFGHQETDLVVQGGPLPLVFTRYYRGHSDRYGTLGFRWSHTYDTFLGIYANGDVSVVFGSGKEEFFAWDSGTSTLTPVDVRIKSTLTKYTSPPDGVDYRYVTQDGMTYNFEGDGDLISIQDRNDNTVTVYRDPTSELVTAVEDPGGRTFDFAYDFNGRLESITGPDGAEVTYTYDANGNRTAVDGDSFTWDWHDRLTAAEVDSTTVAFAYDGDDTRSTKTVGSTTTAYLWDRDAGLLVDDGTTAAIHGAAGPLAEIDGSNAATYPLGDGLGSVRGATDGSGDVVATADDDVFGGVRAQSGTPGVFGWTGEQQDAETGLTYLRARYYAPGSGRFLSRDTVIPNAPGTQGYNPYAYTANNPVTHTDPSGHAFAFTATAAISESGFAGDLAIVGGGAALLAMAAWVGANFAWIAIILLVIVALYFLEQWCLDHDINPGSLDCVGSAASGIAQGGIDIGKSWVTFAVGAAASAGATWDAIPKPWAKPGDRTWPPLPPQVPQPPQPPRAGNPSQDVTRSGPMDPARPLPWPLPWPRTRPAPSDPCTQTLYTIGYRLTSHVRTHIYNRHRPDAPYPQTPKNGRFSETVWPWLDLLIAATLFTPTSIVPQGARCQFNKEPIGFATGINQDNNGITWGVRVIYQRLPGWNHLPGEIVTAFPI